MQFALKQEDIEVAIKLYVRHMGLEQDVKEVTFKQLRKGGFGVEANVRLSVPKVDLTPTPVPSNHTQVVGNVQAVAESVPTPEAATDDGSTDIEPDDETVDTSAKSIFGG